MANTTVRVAMATTPWGDDKVERDLDSTAAIYYPGAMMALNASGVAVKADNTAGLRFDGINCESVRIEVFSSDTVARRVKVERPWRFVMAIAAAVAGDEGKPVYALYDNEVAYSTSNSLLVGWVDKVLSATSVLIRPAWAGINGVATFDGETLTFSGASAGNTVVMPDNLADALSFKEGSNAYLTFVTTNSAESINPLKPLLFANTTGNNLIKLTDNLASALDITEASNSYLKFTTTDGSETVTVTKLLTAVAGLSFTGATTANVLKLTDNLADALNFKEGANSYLKFITTNSAEAIVFGKALTNAVGASTVALGSTNADAAALPAGTAFIYPTTAADDTVGVILDVADKVTGRTVFIGNGVSNKILKVYPPSGGTINGAAANAAFSSASGKGVLITCLSSGSNTWLAM